MVSSHTADSKPVKQEVKGTVILPPSVFIKVFKHCDQHNDLAGEDPESSSGQRDRKLAHHQVGRPGRVGQLQVQGDHQRKDWRGGRGARRTGADVIKLFTFHECSK